jgi:RHS repeat-associated protein
MKKYGFGAGLRWKNSTVFCWLLQMLCLSAVGSAYADNTWTLVAPAIGAPNNANNSVQGFTVDSSDSSTLYSIMNSRAQVSSGGAAWSIVPNAVAPNGINGLLWSLLSSGGKLLATSFNTDGVHVSADKGTHWTAETKVVKDGYTYIYARSTTALGAQGGYFFAQDVGGVLRSTDGLNWTRVYTAPSPSCGDNIYTTNSSIFACGGGVRSTDAGQSWTALGWGAASSFASIGTNIYIVNGAIRKSTDNGTTVASWVNINTKYPGTNLLPTASSSNGITAIGNVLISNYLHKTYMTADDGVTWTQLPPINPADLTITPTALMATSGSTLYVMANTWQIYAINPSSSPVATVDPGATTPASPTINPTTDCRGMCVANAQTMLVSLNLNDTPVGYQPHIGPAAFVRFSYSHREAGQPTSFNYSNMGAKWTHNFLSYIEDDGDSTGLHVKRVVGGGGYVLQTGYSGGIFAREKQSMAVLSRTPATGVASSYSLNYPDGSSQTFGFSASGTTHRLFLTSITDPQGKSLTLAYDGTNRLSSITDAVSHSTSFSYANSNPLLITRVTDPFGRFASMTYDGSGRLASITDVLGITSSFVYDTTDTALIKQLVTPYGTSNFAAGQDGATNYRWLTLTDPLGQTERLEFKAGALGSDTAANVPSGVSVASSGYNQNNSFYWDKYVNSVNAGDYSKATMTHWLTDANGKTSTTAALIKPANDNPVYFNYQGQTVASQEGTLAVPTVIGRKISATTQQVTTLSYNALGQVKTVTDPLLRVSNVDYNATTNDPITVSQKTSASAYSTISAIDYNSQHQATQYTDAALQKWQTSYNLNNQVDKVTDPNLNYTMFLYDGAKRLSGVRNVNGFDVLTLTYDAFDRVRTQQNSDGQVLTYDYDALDRITKVTYPDTTTELYDYTFPNVGNLQTMVPNAVAGQQSLDVWQVTDRQGRVTKYTYDANRRRTSVSETVTIDGMATTRTTSMAYYPNGVLKDLTDASGKVTHWDIWEQGRPKTKTYDYGRSGLSQTEFYAYDLAGRLNTVTDALGQVKTTTYNIDNSVAAYTYTNPAAGSAVTPNVSFIYDQYFPRLASMTDMSGLNGTTGLPAAATTRFDYKALGIVGALQLAKETNDGYYNQHVAYNYDALGRLASRWAAESQEWFHYDTIGRVDQYGTDLGTFNMGYLGQTGLPTSRSVTNGSTTLTTNYGYDTTANDHRLLTINNPNTAVRSYTLGYTYNAGASTDRYNIRSIVENTTVAHPIGKQSWLYSYDGGDRLMSATATTLDAANHASVGAYSWQYDKLDNATQANYPTYSDNPTYNSLNQQTQNAWWQNFTYDSAGNATKEANEANSTLRAYKYDMEGRLAEMTDPRNVGYKVTFTYDGMGRRILQASTTNGFTSYKRYQWCGSTLCQLRDTGTGRKRRYFATGEYVYADGATPAKKYVYFQDQLGSMRDLVDADTGARVGALDYTPYGQVRDSYGVLPDYRYAGLFWVGEVGLNASATRFYDGSTMRWMTRDWIREAGGINGYGYVGGNPVNAIDPLGTTISVIGDGSTQYSKDYIFARRGLEVFSPTMKKILDRLDHSKKDYEIHAWGYGGLNENVYFNTVKNKHFIVWGSRMGLALCGGGYESPLMGLAHELIHAYHEDLGLLNGDEYSPLNPLRAIYDKPEEQDTILGLEQDVAKELGETARFTHWGGFVQVLNPISITPSK